MPQLLTPEQMQAFGHLPAQQPPPGVTPNFVNPYDLAHVLYALAAVAIVLPTITVALRLYSRTVVVRDIGREDYVLVVGWLFHTIYCAFVANAGREHVGRHEWDLQIADVVRLRYNTRFSMIFYGLTTPLIKTSILLQYLRFFSPPGSRDFMFWSCWSLICLTTSYYFVITFVEIFVCTPIQAFWNPWVFKGHCINHLVLYVMAASVNSTTDLLIIVLPQRAIWQLRLKTARKFRTSCIFLVGLFALAASVVRLYYAIELLQSTDYTYEKTLMLFWTLAEMAITIICSCLPSLARLAVFWKSRRIDFSLSYFSSGTEV